MSGHALFAEIFFDVSELSKSQMNLSFCIDSVAAVERPVLSV